MSGYSELSKDSPNRLTSSCIHAPRVIVSPVSNSDTSSAGDSSVFSVCVSIGSSVSPLCLSARADTGINVSAMQNVRRTHNVRFFTAIPPP